METSVTHRHFEPYPHDKLFARTILRRIPHWVTPNQITILRIILTPVCLWLLWREDYAIGVPFFLLLGFSDALDGSLARIRKQVTVWGMVADPVADKLLIASVAVILLFRQFPMEIVIMIVGMEAMFLLGGWYWRQRGQIVSANVWGKSKMVMQVLGITLYLLSLSFTAPFLALASFGVLGLAMALAVVSLWTQGT